MSPARIRSPWDFLPLPTPTEILVTGLYARSARLDDVRLDDALAFAAQCADEHSTTMLAIVALEAFGHEECVLRWLAWLRGPPDAPDRNVDYPTTAGKALAYHRVLYAACVRDHGREQAWSTALEWAVDWCCRNCIICFFGTEDDGTNGEVTVAAGTPRPGRRKLKPKEEKPKDEPPEDDGPTGPP